MARFRKFRREQATAALSRAEFDALPAKDRAELHNTARGSRLQVINTLGIVFGLIFTAGSLVFTAQTLNATRQDQRILQEGQITDRYIRSIEKLGDKNPDIQLGAIYALERIAKDSPADRKTIIDVLAAYVLAHDPPSPSGKLSTKPTTTIQAALTVLGRIKPIDDSPGWLDLARAEVPSSNLSHAFLARADLAHVQLAHARLPHADLTGANLTGAVLAGADLTDAVLAGAKLHTTIFDNAHLEGADFRGADLTTAVGLPRTDELKKIVQWNGQTKFSAFSR
ncbi:pentapeptide repeat-containing protein [Nonomuraea endophytica]|uniref:pentapeptide repeat-containing protein n=1 Tax=Nonomuraea endophytica TaxID=714136 RepID=UPI0037C85446